ncbi:hypothetical protein HDU98_003680 [Podochytrium sp. JEL0797]|nr:hypothetical protein HDU98_003680 [Podochytrium sp. JEL0797]
MQAQREHLIGEQRELLAERERCIAVGDETYMDARLADLDCEIALHNARIRPLSDEIKFGKATAAMESDVEICLDTSVRQSDLGWENAVNLLRSLDSVEMEYVAVLLLEDLVEGQIAMKTLERRMEEANASVVDKSIELGMMREAALQMAKYYRQEMEDIWARAEQKIGETRVEKGVSAGGAGVGGGGGMKKSALGRSRSSLFSYEEFGAATPKLQKMFDSAYGHNYIRVPSHRVTSCEIGKGGVEPLDLEGVDSALRKAKVEEGEDGMEEDLGEGDAVGVVAMDTGREAGEEEETSSEEEEPVSPVRNRRQSSEMLGTHTPGWRDPNWVPPKDEERPVSPTLPKRYNLRPRRISNDSESSASLNSFARESNEAGVDSVVSPVPPTLSQPLAEDEPPVEPVTPAIMEEDENEEPPANLHVTTRRGRTNLRAFLLSPSKNKAVRAMSVPSSPVDPTSNKSIIKNFIHAQAQKSKTLRAAAAAANGGLSVMDLENDATVVVGGGVREDEVGEGVVRDRGSNALDAAVDAAAQVRKRLAKNLMEVGGPLEATGDVFSRLATSHTLASQAKVIHRDAVGGGGEGHAVGGGVGGASVAAGPAGRKMSIE